ncbi:uncharacterized protein LOC135841640 isoform X1 [Planococcus citri]|uniref:uncharacterized protein LOC135841640 isoform X1 n=1 Tax=Planococcus citri TaxID=170843 RepID=UPI0031F913D1
MEKKDENYKRLYPELPDAIESISTQDENSDEEAGEEFITHRSSPTTHQRTPSSATHSPIRKPQSEDTQETNGVSVLFLFIMFLAPILATISYRMYNRETAPVTSKAEWKDIVTKLQPHLMEKRNKFPSQKEDIWFQISSGLKGLSNDPKNPAVYLLTYDENSMHPSSCIVEVITTAANSFMLEKNGWSFLNGSLLTDSQINDPGELIDKIANTIEKHKIMVVTDVQHIPAKLAQGFHFLVDEYNPVIREAVYVLTLKIPSHLKSSKPVEAAENALKESWKELKNDLLLPLITRVTNQVLPVVAENSEISCPLITSVTTEIFI